MGTGLVNVDLREGEGMRDIKQVFHYGPITSMKIPSQALHRILYSDLKTGAVAYRLIATMFFNAFFN